jgi:hypothetical protein
MDVTESEFVSDRNQIISLKIQYQISLLKSEVEFWRICHIPIVAVYTRL